MYVYTKHVWMYIGCERIWRLWTNNSFSAFPVSVYNMYATYGVLLSVCLLIYCIVYVHDDRRLKTMLDGVRDKVVYGGETGLYTFCILTFV